MNRPICPKARTRGLLISTLDQETIVYDTETDGSGVKT